MQYQEHHGRRFYLDKKTGYWISTDYPRVRAHVWVWNCVNGETKKGLHIHHIDGDKSHNSISNLQCITPSDHLKLHMTPKRKKLLRELVDIIRPLSKLWHASEEGIKWHVEHGKRCWEKREAVFLKCRMCGNDFSTKFKFQKFCHPNCKAKYGRRIQKNKVNP